MRRRGGGGGGAGDSITSTSAICSAHDHFLFERDDAFTAESEAVGSPPALRRSWLVRLLSRGARSDAPTTSMRTPGSVIPCESVTVIAIPARAGAGRGAGFGAGFGAGWAGWG